MSGVLAQLPLMVVGFVAMAAPVHAQVDFLMGGSYVRGTLQTPYFYECSGDGTEAAGGLTAHFGLELASFSATATYLNVGDVSSDFDCRIPPPPPDGIHEAREFPRRSSHIWGWAFHLRYAPPGLPALVYLGGGFESEGNEFVSAGAAFRSPGRLGVLAGAEMTHLHTPFVAWEETWRGGERESRVESGEVTPGGSSWCSGSASNTGCA